MSELTPTPVADADDLEMLQDAAAGLSEAAITVALRIAGAASRAGLAGVPKAKVWPVCSILRATKRSNVVERMGHREAFERGQAA